MTSAVTSTTAISTPAGWIKLAEITAGITRTAWYWRISTGVPAGADAAPTFTSTIVGTGGMAGVPFELSGAADEALFATTGNNTTVTTTTLASGTTSGNVPVAGCLALTAFGLFTSTAATRTWTPGAGWSNVASTVAISQRLGMVVDQLANPTANATLAESGTFSTTPTNESNFIIVIPPSGIPIVAMSQLTGA
jgi:hypothetical protein